MSQLHHPRPYDEELNGNKRRKVNTCLQCKARKVKCDKVRPLCGPCQRRRIPADRCVFADEADPETLQHYLGPEYLAQQGYHMSQLNAQSTVAQASNLLAFQDPQARAVLDRITREIRQGEAPDTVNSDGVAAAAVAAASGGNLNPAIDGTILATTTVAGPNGAGAAAKTAAETMRTLEPANLFPFASEPTHERTKLILGLLPNDHVVNVLLDSLRTFESKSPLAISWRLIRIQLINLRGDISDWRTGQVEEPDVDLSFLALLFDLMVSAIDCKPVEEIISEGIALTPEQVPEMTDRWHATCQALLAMSNFVHEPNINTVCTEFLFYLYELRRGRSRLALNHLQSSFSRAKLICMHQLSSAQEDATRWSTTSESDDLTIRTGAVTAMRKAQFEGGEVFAISEEQTLLDSIRPSSSSSSSTIRRRELLQTNIPDRTHLVREAARMLFVSLTWHLELVTPSPPLADAIGDSIWTTELGSIDEAHLPDGESASLPSGPTLSSISTHFFQFLAASTQFLLRQKRQQPHTSQVVRVELLGVVSEWNGIAETHLTRIREQIGADRTMLNHFSLLIHHWTRIRLLRPYFGQLEESPSLAASRLTLIDSCREALSQVSKIVATTSDVHLSIFHPLVSAIKTNATLILSLHLLVRANFNDSNGTAEWAQVRDLVKGSLPLLWTSTLEAGQHRLGEFKAWRKQFRAMVEEILIAAFERKRVALEEQPRIKNEDGELPEKKGLDAEDKVEDSVGGVTEDNALKVYKAEMLKDGDPIWRHSLVFDSLESYLRSL